MKSAPVIRCLAIFCGFRNSAARHALTAIGLVPVCLLIASGSSASSDTAARPASSGALTVKAIADAVVDQRRPRKNFGAQRVLSLTPGSRAYLRFKLKQMPERIVRATLRVYVTKGAADVVVTGARGRWKEKSITFKNAPQLSLPEVRRSARAKSWHNIDVTGLVGFARTVELVVAPGAGQRLTLASRESRAGAPRLVLELGDPAVGAAGDVACDPADANFNGAAGSRTGCHMRATSDLLVGSGLTSVLVLGDAQYENGTLDKFRASYDPTWGRVDAIAHPAVGNHEYQTRDAAGYFQYFGSAAGDSGAGYYSFDIGRWHIVALNSNCSKAGGCDVGSPQESWLRNDLQTHRNGVCTLAYWHHPRFSSGRHGNTASMQPIWQTLYQFGTELVLSGHDHDYERFAPQRSGGSLDAERGIREFVVGTGGKNLISFSRTVRKNSEV